MAGISCVFTLGALSFAYGARISTRLQLDGNSRSAARVGPDGEAWTVNTKYVCMQKWQSSGFSGQFVSSYCLVDYAKARGMAQDHFKVAADLSLCDSTRKKHKMRTCALKGKAPAGRLSWKTRAYVPKSCFRLSSKGEAVAFPVLEAAVGEDECAAALSAREEEQGTFRPRLTTTTSTTTTTTTTEDLDSLDEDDRFDRPIMSETIEAVSLFTSGEEKLWEYRGKSIKCCTSTKGLPTKLQDMNANQLPAARSLGKSTGCGYMFGNTYHNGPKRQGTCPVRTLFASSEDVAAIRSSLADRSSSFVESGNAGSSGI
mmetsp:Transcript_105069/g.165792  ORF Transcript_105069/g.165792 Transcript_105069/m.165792 type:complete len:315 (-) Transcript_105069:218-1162(-)